MIQFRVSGVVFRVQGVFKFWELGSFCIGKSRPGGLKALPTKTKVESGTSQSKHGTSVNVSNSGFQASGCGVQGAGSSQCLGFRG